MLRLAVRGLRDVRAGRQWTKWTTGRQASACACTCRATPRLSAGAGAFARRASGLLGWRGPGYGDLPYPGVFPTSGAFSGVLSMMRPVTGPRTLGRAWPRSPEVGLFRFCSPFWRLFPAEKERGLSATIVTLAHRTRRRLIASHPHTGRKVETAQTDPSRRHHRAPIQGFRSMVST